VRFGASFTGSGISYRGIGTADTTIIHCRNVKGERLVAHWGRSVMELPVVGAQAPPRSESEATCGGRPQESV